jgi:hypothetical protein
MPSSDANLEQNAAKSKAQVLRGADARLLQNFFGRHEAFVLVGLARSGGLHVNALGSALGARRDVQGQVSTSALPRLCCTS